MTDPDTRARNRYFLMVGARLISVGGAILGVLIIGKAQTLEPKILGVAIVISALIVMAVVPRHLARRWRTPPKL